MTEYKQCPLCKGRGERMVRRPSWDAGATPHPEGCMACKGEGLILKTTKEIMEEDKKTFNNHISDIGSWMSFYESSTTLGEECRGDRILNTRKALKGIKELFYKYHDKN